MPAGVPAAEEAVQIFNQLVHTAAAETEAIGQAEWRLRVLARQRPSDLTIDVAHLYALILLGRAPEAIKLAERLWPNWHNMQAQQFETYMSGLATLGMYEQAAELLAVVKERDVGGLIVTPVFEAALAWGVGDLDWMRRVAVVAPWPEYLDQLEALGLASTFRKRQEIVRSKIFGKQCLSYLLLVPGLQVRQSAVRYCYIAGSYEDRIALEEEIQADLDALYAPLGLADVHWDAMSDIIVPITAAPPTHEGYYYEAA